MKQENKTWFDALLSRPDCNNIISSYIIKHSQRFSVFGGIVSIEKFTDEEIGNMLKIVYKQHRRLDKDNEVLTTMYWGEHSLFTVDKDGKFKNQLNINTITDSASADVYNILSIANSCVAINDNTYEAEHKTYCKKELAMQYLASVKELKERQNMLATTYNYAIENLSESLKESRGDFRKIKSKFFPTM